jgi:spore coat protein U-like protein
MTLSPAARPSSTTIGTSMPATTCATVVSSARWRVSAVALALALIVAASNAEAACTVRIESSVAFGTYNVFNATPLNSTGQISYRCTGNTNPTIQISLSRGGSPTFLPRQLRQGTEVLSYNLFRDANRTIVWGDGTSGTQIYSAGRTTGRIYVSVYGSIPAAQDAAVGAYTDSVTVLINF